MEKGPSPRRYPDVTVVYTLNKHLSTNCERRRGRVVSRVFINSDTSSSLLLHDYQGVISSSDLDTLKLIMVFILDRNGDLITMHLLKINEYVQSIDFCICSCH